MRRVKHNFFRVATNYFAGCDISDTIVVSGSPRSGTTWTAEIMREFPGYKMLNEPLNLDQHPKLKTAGLDWRTYVPPHGDRATVYSHLQDVLQGREVRVWKWRFKADSPLGMLLEHLTRRRLVVKMIRASRMLQWFAATFPVRGIVYVIRHPCSVVASMMKYGNWDEYQTTISRSTVPGGAIPPELYDEFEGVLDSVSTQVECLAVLWSLDYHIALHRHSHEGWPWILVPYERMLTNGGQELSRLASLLGFDSVPEGARQRIGVASRSSSNTLQADDAELQLTKWRRQLDSSQIDNILRIANAFGLGFYSRDPEPDYEALCQFQCEEAQVGQRS